MKNANENEVVYVDLDLNPDGEIPESHGPQVVYADIATFQPESQPLKSATEDGHHQDWSQSLNSNPKQESKENGEMNKKCDQRTNKECGWNCWTIRLIFLCFGICVIVGAAWFAYGALKENPEPWATEAICWVKGVFGQGCNIEQSGSVNSSTDSPTTGSTHSPVTGEKPKDTPENPSVTTQTTQSPTTMTATEATTGPTKGTCADKIFVAMKNDVHKKQSRNAGLYTKNGTYSERPIFYKRDGDATAIWFKEGVWRFSDVGDIGKNIFSLYSNNNQLCPDGRENKWSYWYGHQLMDAGQNINVSPHTDTCSHTVHVSMKNRVQSQYSQRGGDYEKNGAWAGMPVYHQTGGNHAIWLRGMWRIGHKSYIGSNYGITSLDTYKCPHGQDTDWEYYDNYH